MNNLTPILICLFLLNASLQGQTLTKQEAAVVQAIEDDIRYFDQRNYDKWAAMWVHEPYVEDVWAGPGGHGKLVGWEEMDQFGKTFMKNNPTPGSTNFKGEDFDFLIKGDLAIVSYSFQGERITRTLEKRAGAWKMVRILRLQVGGYQSMAFINQLRAIEGKWQLLPGSVEVKHSNWKIEQADCLATGIPGGLRLQIHYAARNPNGDLQQAQEEIAVMLHSADQQITATRTWHWEASGQNFVSTGLGEMDDGKLVVSTISVGAGAERVKHMIHSMNSGKLAVETIFFPGEDREWSLSYQLEKTSGRR